MSVVYLVYSPFDNTLPANVERLLLTGGADVDPARYGEARHATVTDVDAARVEYEIALVRAAMAADFPVLAICRGLQVMNVALGGSLIQDVPSQVGAAVPHHVPDQKDAIAHEVSVVAGSRLAELMGQTVVNGQLPVNSRHHQAVGRLADGFVVTRPSHTYRSPQYEVDLALAEGRIDRTLPYIKRESVRILTEKEYASHEEARAGIPAGVNAFYSQAYPDLAGSPAVEQAGKALGDAYCWNNFPHMKVKWNLYPNHIGHQDTPGCFRCHDNKHKTEAGDKIGKKCNTCHEVVTEEESTPCCCRNWACRRHELSNPRPKRAPNPRPGPEQSPAS